jgi:hypothetical protein
MIKKKPLVLTNGKVSQLDILTEEILGAPDFHSGYSEILPTKSIVVGEGKQMITFISLLLDGDLTLDGDLWLA